MTERQARDEGATQTAMIMEAVKRARTAKGWSAAQLADAMSAAGIPWNRSVVENLEYGRRKSLRVHELTTLTYVLDLASPIELLAPAVAREIPVTPLVTVATIDARAWCWGQIGPLAAWLAAEPYEREAIRVRSYHAARGAAALAEIKLQASTGWWTAPPEGEDPEGTYFDGQN